MSTSGNRLPPDPASATREQLRRRLSSAPGPWLDAALDNPAIGPSELLLVLRNAAAPAVVLERIGANRDWMEHHEVRRGLARHARTPLHLARTLLPLLFWKDWCEIAAHPAANPVIRRQAEEMLRSRLGELGGGERMSLARRATRGLIPQLLADGDARVIQALLGNPLLVELDLVKLAGAPGSSAEALRLLAEHPVWGARREVRLTLLRRDELPVQIALGLARKLTTRDRQALVEDDKVPLVVRVGIERGLRGDTRRGAASGDSNSTGKGS